MSIIKQIKAEIKRLQATNPSEYNCENAVGYMWALNDLLSFLDTLESEKPMNLEEEINRYLHEECSDDDEPGIHEIAEHFAEWGYLRAAEKYNEIEYNRQRAEESVPNDLEEAATITLDEAEGVADEYTGFLAKGLIENQPRPIGGKWFIEYARKRFIAGAKWQEEKDQETIKLAEDHAYLAGAVNEREKMMKEAVEADVNIYRDLAAGKSWAEFVVEMPTNNLGDKVRIIIVKEDNHE